MKRWLLFLFLFAAPAFLTGFAVGQAPPREHAEIRVLGKYTLVIQEAPFTLSAPAGGDLYFWKLPASWTTTDQNDSIVVTAAPEGAYSVSCTVISIQWEAKKTAKATYALSLAVGKAPKPPDPIPPKPPDPTPPSPSEVKNPRVLILYENDDLKTYPIKQHAILYSPSVYDKLNALCPTVPALNRKHWSISDKDMALSGVSADLEQMRNRPRKGLPWIIVRSEDGTIVHEDTLPATIDDTLTLLDRFAPKAMKGGKH